MSFDQPSLPEWFASLASKELPYYTNNHLGSLASATRLAKPYQTIYVIIEARAVLLEGFARSGQRSDIEA
jgi:hypothetical protein